MMACATAEVARRPGGRIALLGGVMINFGTMSDTLFFAHVIRQVSQLLKTMVHNRGLHGAKVEEGRPERIARYGNSLDHFNSSVLNPMLSRSKGPLTRGGTVSARDHLMARSCRLPVTPRSARASRATV